MYFFKKCKKIVLLSSLLVPFFSEADKRLSNDISAFTYCLTTSTSYIAIVWPQGIDQLDYVTQTLDTYALVNYVKIVTLTERQMLKLYRNLHKSMSSKSSKKYFRPYISKFAKEPYQIAVVVFTTPEPLESLLIWKKEMRDHIGLSYYSIHINDYYSQTLDAAYALFLPNSLWLRRRG